MPSCGNPSPSPSPSPSPNPSPNPNPKVRRVAYARRQQWLPQDGRPPRLRRRGLLRLRRGRRRGQYAVGMTYYLRGSLVADELCAMIGARLWRLGHVPWFRRDVASVREGDVSSCFFLSSLVARRCTEFPPFSTLLGTRERSLVPKEGRKDTHSAAPPHDGSSIGAHSE